MTPARRLAAGLLLLLVAVAAALAFVEVRSDAAAAFPHAEDDIDALETPAGRESVIALRAPDMATAAEAAQALAAALGDEPLIETASSGPAPPAAGLEDWLWLHRLRLAPPADGDLTPEAMAERLREAQAAMATSRGMAVGDRLLRDPTGAFARLLERLEAAGRGQPVQDGAWRARNEDAALVFVRFADGEFDARSVAALSERIRGQAEATGAQALIAGPRFIAAEVAGSIQRASTIGAGSACLLLLGWLIWLLRSARGLLAALLPTALGAACGALAVQAIFGSVHVIALGFGGALTGLALDYPLHVLGHAGGADGRAPRPLARAILLGAGTTALAFLATLASGVPALAQTGVFVAVGLMAAAGACLLVTPAAAAVQRPLRLPAAERMRWRLPGGRATLVVIAAAGLAAAVLAPAQPESRAFAPPDETTAELKAVMEMVGAASSATAVIVEGGSEQEVLERLALLRPVLEAARAEGLLAEAVRSVELPPPLSDQSPDLPSAEGFAQRAEQALSLAGMNPGFAETLRDDYASAREAETVAPSDLARFPSLEAAARLPSPVQGGWRTLIALPPSSDPAAMAERVEAVSPGVRVIDPASDAAAGLRRLRDRALTTLALGSLAGFALVAVSTGAGVALNIALRAAAALGLAAGVLAAAGVSFGVFQVVALALVVGIGIDYGLILGLAEDEAGRRDAARSVTACAGSTLAAFLALAATDAVLLREIGAAVSLGVIGMLSFSLAAPTASAAPIER